MSRLRSLILNTLVAIGALTTSHTSLAQEAAEEVADRWYQVEVLLFAQAEEHANQELWRQDIALAYAPNWVALKSIDDELAARAEEAEQQALLAQETENNVADDINSPPPAAEIIEAETEETEITALDLSKQAFFKLLPDDREMNDKRRSLHWNKQYRVLFHQAWRQPIYNKDRAQAILISAGKEFGDHSELEGTITLRVSRYLHLETNLWMTKFQHNFGQQPGDWPKLPVRPDQREYLLEQQAELSGDKLDFPTDSGRNSPWSNFSTTDNEYEYILTEPFIPERISLLKQKRRMRSNETHLIDHPVVSMIIKVTPYDPNAEEEELPEETGETESTDSQ